MNTQSLDIDLAFTAFNINMLEEPLKSQEETLLMESKSWKYRLTNWLLFLRQQANLACPKVVRSSSRMSLGIEMTDDEKIKELNQQWRHKPFATDVLSFPVIDDTYTFSSHQCIELGDIVISVPTAKRQALEHGNDFARELQWLVTHGLLHLLGWDHQDENSLQEMLYVQDQMLEFSDNLSNSLN